MVALVAAIGTYHWLQGSVSTCQRQRPVLICHDIDRQRGIFLKESIEALSAT